MPTPTLFLHADGAVDVFPDAWHATASGQVTRGGAGAVPPAPAGVAQVDDGVLIAGPACRIPVGEAYVRVIATGPDTVAIAGMTSVLVVDVAACRPAGIIPVLATRAMAVDNTRLVTLNENGRLRWFDWRDGTPTGSVALPRTCGGVWVGADGPTTDCGGGQVSLLDGRPAPKAAHLQPQALFRRGGEGWALWDPQTGARLTKPVGAGDPAAELDPTTQLVVTWDPKAAGAARRIHAWNLEDGRERWSSPVAGERRLSVQPGAVVLSTRDIVELHDPLDGHLVWTLHITGPGLDAVTIEADGRQGHAGTPEAPAWTGRALPANPLPAKVPPPPAPPKGRVADAARATDAATEGTPPSAPPDTAPTRLDGDLGPFADCGAAVPMTSQAQLQVPVRKDAPTLVFVGTDDAYRAPEGADVIYYFALRDELAGLSDPSPNPEGDTHLATWGGFTTDRTPPFGLHFGEALMVSGDCRILARGSADSVVDAATRWAYTKVNRALPTKVAAPVQSARTPAFVGALLPLAGERLAWSSLGVGGVLDGQGRALWTHSSLRSRLASDGEHLFEATREAVQEVDEATGDTIRVVAGAVGVLGLGKAGLLLDRKDDVVLVDPVTLAVRRSFGPGAGLYHLDDDAVTASWAPPTGPTWTCRTPPRGPQVCASAGLPALALGNLQLELGLDHVLRATDKRGRERWTLHGVYDVAPGPDHLVLAQLGSSHGQYVTVDERGRLREWLPINGHPLAQGLGTYGRELVVWWRR